MNVPLLSCILALLMAPLGAQVAISDLPPPGDNGDNVLMWDTWNRRLLMVTMEIPNRIKTFDGSSWQVLSTAPFPARYGLAAAFDPLRGRALLCSGLDRATSAFSTVLWSWDGQNWTQEPTGNGAPTGYFTAVYDTAQDRLVLKARTSCALHAWDGAGWARLPGWSSCPNPYGFDLPGYDESLGTVTLYRTELIGSTGWYTRYALAPAGWVSTPIRILNGVQPGPWPFQRSAAATLSSGAKLILAINGYGRIEATECNGDFAMYLLKAPGSSNFIVNSICVDPATDRVYISGGNHCAVVTAAPVAAWWHLSSAGCQGASYNFRLGNMTSNGPRCGTTWDLGLSDVTTAPPPLLLVGSSRQWYLNARLPLDLGPLGMPGCTLQVAIDAMVLGTADGTRHAVFHVAVPPAPWLVGRDVFLQAAGAAPGFNAAGLVLSDALVARIGL